MDAPSRGMLDRMSPDTKTILFDFANVLYLPEGLNTDLLNFIQNSLLLRYQLVVVTASSTWQSPEIRPVLEKIFAEIITTTQLGFAKSQPEAFRALARQLDVPVNNLILIDDMPANINAITQAGGTGILFRDNSQLVIELRKLDIPTNR